MSTRQAKQVLWLDESRGVYIPKAFADSFKDRDSCVTGVDADTWAILEAGPKHEWYWEAWEDVCRDAVVTDTDGTRYTVWQDGTCWLVEHGAEWDETGKISETGWYITTDDE